MIKKLNQREALLMFLDWMFDDEDGGVELGKKYDFSDVALLAHEFADANNLPDVREIDEVIALTYVPTVNTDGKSEHNIDVVLEHRRKLYDDAEETTNGVVN